MKVKYRCLYNLDMGMTSTRFIPMFDEELSKEVIEHYVDEVAGTDVDAFMCCPTFLRLPLWRSEIETHWTHDAPDETEPVQPKEFIDTTYYRLRRYIIKGGDPVGDIVNACKRNGIAAFFSYRMNDNHHLFDPANRNLDDYWRSHPEYYLNEGWDYNQSLKLDYIYDDVREHYFRILEEPVEMYDVDGLELDFMRSAPYFKEAETARGAEMMTMLVERVRKMLDRFGNARGKYLPLSVHVPSSLQKAQSYGLYVDKWCQMGLVDMINVTPAFYGYSIYANLRSYREISDDVAVYGEIQFNASGTAERVMSPQAFKTAAHQFLSEGADGISFFNMTGFYNLYHRNSSMLPKVFHTGLRKSDLCGNLDRETLAQGERHYCIPAADICSIRPDYRLKRDGKLPIRMWQFSLEMFDLNDHYTSAVLRVEMKEIAHGFPLIVYVNGTELEEYISSGELFQPTDVTALPAPQMTRFYRLPLETLKGINDIQIRLYDVPGNVWDHVNTILGCEIALYL